MVCARQGGEMDLLDLHHFGISMASGVGTFIRLLTDETGDDTDAQSIQEGTKQTVGDHTVR